MKDFLKLSDDNPDVMDTRKYIADLYRKQNKYSEAIKRYCDLLVAYLLKVRNGGLGEDDPPILDTRYGLAWAFRGQGDTTDALQHAQRVWDVRKAGLELDHPKTLKAAHLMATLHNDRGDYDTAFKIHQEVLDSQRESLGKHHYATLDTIHSIGGIQKKKEDYTRALERYEEVLCGLEDVFGKGNSHPFTLSVRKDIADVWELGGKFDEALEAFEKLHLLHKNSQPGTDSLWVLATANDIGRVRNRKGHHKSALEWCQKTVEGIEKKIEDGEIKNHFLLPASKITIAAVHENQGQYAQALISYRQALEMYERTRGGKHTTTLRVSCFIAKILNKQGKYDEALKIFNEVEKRQREAVGGKHPSFLEAILGKGDLHQNIGQHETAKKCHKEVMDVLKEGKDKEHLLMPQAKYGMGRVLESRKKYDEAIELYEYATDRWIKRLGRDQTLVLTAKHRIGGVRQKQKKYHEALRLYTEILGEILREDHPLREEQPLRTGHPLRYETSCSMGSALFRLRRFGEARTSYEEARGGLGLMLGEDHQITLAVMHGLADLLKKQKDYAQALELHESGSGADWDIG